MASDREKDFLEMDWERLIVRQLDGALSSDEDLALNRELIRNPEARTIAEEYRRVDERAAAALAGVAEDRGLSLDIRSLRDRTAPVPTRRYARSWWLLPGAIAAAIGALALVRGPMVVEEYPQVAGHHRLDSLPGSGSWVPPREFPGGVRPIRQAASQPALRQSARDIDRELLGVVGDDGNIYWVEVDRTRTIHGPNPRSAVRRAAGDM